MSGNHILLCFAHSMFRASFLLFRYARLKAAIDEISAAVAAAREERRGVRTGGLGSGGDERREREKEKDRKRERDTAERDRSEHRYVLDFFYCKCSESNARKLVEASWSRHRQTYENSFCCVSL